MDILWTNLIWLLMTNMLYIRSSVNGVNPLFIELFL